MAKREEEEEEKDTPEHLILGATEMKVSMTEVAPLLAIAPPAPTWKSAVVMSVMTAARPPIVPIPIPILSRRQIRLIALREPIGRWQDQNQDQPVGLLRSGLSLRHQASIGWSATRHMQPRTPPRRQLRPFELSPPVGDCCSQALRCKIELTSYGHWLIWPAGGSCWVLESGSWIGWLVP